MNVIIEHFLRNAIPMQIMQTKKLWKHRFLIPTMLGATLLSASANEANQVAPLGMCSNGRFLVEQSYAPALIGAGADMVRVDIPFRVVREKDGSNPEQWDWSWFQHAHEIHRKNPSLHFLPIIGYGTNWAAATKSSTGDGTNQPQRGVDVVPAWSPQNLYGNFVFESVKRYKDDIHYWESWNEPDLPGHAFFAGTGSEFLKYQRTCYMAAKHADPNCVVLFAGLCFANVEGYLKSHNLNPPSPDTAKTSFFEDYLKACVQDPESKKNNYYFDVMNQHTYSRATDLFDYTQVDRALMLKYLNQDKPIWVTEYGFVDAGGIWGGNADDYCDYIIQSYVWAKLARVEKLFHFQLDNSNGHGLYSQQLGEPKPALASYREVVAKHLAPLKLVSQLHGNAGCGFLEGNTPYKGRKATGYNLFKFEDLSKTKHCYVCFADSSAKVNIEIPASAGWKANLVDRHGVTKPLSAEGGVYKVGLPGATNLAGWPASNDPKGKAMGSPEHLVGGSTYVIVESKN